MFKQPSVTIGVNLGYAVPRAGSEVFDFTREQLTIEKSDFNAFAFGGGISVRTSSRIDVAFNLGHARSNARSEFREFVGTDDLPIVQETRFSRVPVTVGVKAYLTERGRRISRLAWVPNKWAPWVGAGGGAVWYRFEQFGEFVDFETFEIFLDEFESSGASPTAYLAAGVDYSLGSRWLITGEGRYSWGSADMDRDFVGFDKIDLAGFQATAGISVRL